MKKQAKWWQATTLILLCAGLCLAQGTVNAWQSAQKGPAGAELNAVYFVESKHGWIGGDNGFIIHTQDSGANWTPQKLSTDASINDIYFLNKDEGYLLTGQAIWRSNDGGNTWNNLFAPQPKEYGADLLELYSVRFSNKKKGWVVGSLSVKETRKTETVEKVVDSLLLRTEDGGQTWRRWRVPTSDELIHLELAGDKKAWVVGANGTIIYTDAGGESWRIQRSNVKATLYHVDFRNDKNGLAVGQKGTLLRTLDGGETWIPTTLPTQNTLLSVAMINDDEAWAVGRNGTVLRTIDGGVTWTQQEVSAKNNIYALHFDKKLGCAVGAEGLVLQYTRK